MVLRMNRCRDFFRAQTAASLGVSPAWPWNIIFTCHVPSSEPPDLLLLFVRSAHLPSRAGRILYSSLPRIASSATSSPLRLPATRVTVCLRPRRLRLYAVRSASSAQPCVFLEGLEGVPVEGARVPQVVVDGPSCYVHSLRAPDEVHNVLTVDVA